MRGVCTYCSCTDAEACLVESTQPNVIEGDLEPCRWIDSEHTVCSGCVVEHQNATGGIMLRGTVI